MSGFGRHDGRVEPGHRFERGVSDLHLDNCWGSGVLARMLADLPLPAEHPQRVGDFGGEPALDVAVRRIGSSRR